MIACKQVSKALANHRYYELPWWRKIPMFAHIKLCVMCGKYHQQVVTMQKDAGDVETHVHLSDEARKRIEDALKNQNS
jgi:arginyl-tRNA synthetase